MAKFHTNAKGEPGRCSAQQDNCPFGGSEDHYSTPAAARAAYEELQQTSFRQALSKANQKEEQLRVRFSASLAILEDRGIDPEGENGYTPEAIREFLATAEELNVRDDEVADWLDTSDSYDAAMLNLHGFAYETGWLVPIPGSEKTHADQLGHRVGPYLVTSRPVATSTTALGQLSPRYETMIIDERTGEDVEGRSSRSSEDFETNHKWAIWWAQANMPTNGN